MEDMYLQASQEQYDDADVGELGGHSDSDDDDFCEGLGWLEEVCGEFERMPIHLDQAWR